MRSSRRLVAPAWIPGLVLAAAAAFAAVLVGCGPPPAEVGLNLVLSSSSPIDRLTCQATQTEFEDKLSAELRVGGYPACELLVNKVDGTAGGTCSQIVVGLPRPAMLVWFLDPPAGKTKAPISYHITSIDLRRSSLDDGQTSVDVTFDNPTTSRNFWHPSQFSEITAAEGVSEATRTDLESALAWANGPEGDGGGIVTDPQPFLDRDTDTCANLVEACNGGAALLYNDAETTFPGNSCTPVNPPAP